MFEWKRKQEFDYFVVKCPKNKIDQLNYIILTLGGEIDNSCILEKE